MKRLSPSEEKEKFQQGIDQFNSGQFFEAHESWEEIWLAAPEPEKTFLQGIIQVSAAFHHYRRDNRAGAESLLGEGLRKLDRFPSMHRGLKIAELREFVRYWLVALERDDREVLQRAPRLDPHES